MNSKLCPIVFALLLAGSFGCSKTDSTASDTSKAADGANSPATDPAPPGAQSAQNAPGGGRTVVISDGGVRTDGTVVKKDSVTTPNVEVKKDSVKTKDGVEVTKDGVKTPGGVNVKVPTGY